MHTFFVGFGNLRNVTVFSAGSTKLKEILKECEELILTFTVGQEEGEEDGEVTGFQEDLLSQILCEFTSKNGTLMNILKRR